MPKGTPDQIREQRRRRRLRHKALVDETKAASGCSRCDEADPAALDFHHVGEKRFQLIGNEIASRNAADIREEIARCVVLCANCHRKLHHGGKRSSEQLRLDDLAA